MNIKNVKIKERLTDRELAMFAEGVAELLFPTDFSGVKTYSPYMKHIGYKTMFFIYCIDGLTFEHDVDGNIEDVLSAIESDKKLQALYKDFVEGKYVDKEICKQIKEIVPLIDETIEFKKGRLLTMQQNGFNYLFASLGNIINNLGEDGLPELIARAYEKINTISTKGMTHED